MKIELACIMCKDPLDSFEITQETWNKYKDGCMRIDSPFCRDCANRYMYSGGTMKLEELESRGEVISKVSPMESHLG